MKTKLFLFLTYSLFLFQLQAQDQKLFVCGTEESTEFVPTGGEYTPNGRIHTMKGELKVLIVFAGFEGFLDNPFGNWPIIQDGNVPGEENNWGLPPWVVYENGEISMDEFLFNDPSDFDDVPGSPMNDPNNRSISKSLYLMSSGQFKLMGVPFYDYDNQGEPIPTMVIPTDLITDPPGAWKEMHRLVLPELANINSSFPADLEGLDLRTEITQADHYKVDNSTGSVPDDKFDLTFIIYRYGGWDIIPNVNNPMSGWAGSGGGAAYLDGFGTPAGTQLNGKTFEKGAMIADSRSSKNVNSVFLHELSHLLMQGDHQMGSGVAGYYGWSPLTCGWGTMGTVRPLFYPMLNAWERWWNGYIDPPTLTSIDNNIEVWLRDYVTTGDVIRIKIPFSDLSYGGGDDEYQHLWIENHTGKTGFDQNPNQGFQIMNEGALLATVPGSDLGVYMFVDDMNEFREMPNGSLNALRPINASKNFDYVINQGVHYIDSEGKPFFFQFEKDEENVIGGNNPWFSSFYNIDDPNIVNIRRHGEIARELINGNDEVLVRSYGGFDPGFSTYARSPAFKVGDHIEINSNPIIFNYPEPDVVDISEPNDPPGEIHIIAGPSFYLNGLSVEFLELDLTSDINSADYRKIKVKIGFDQLSVTKNARWAGATIVLPDITGNNDSDLIIEEAKMITLDKSETLNATESHWEGGLPESFSYAVKPTTLIISKDSRLHMEENSNLTIKNGSTLIIEDGAEVLLDNGACIVVEETGTLILKGNNIHLNGEDALISIRGKLITADGVDFTFTGPGYADFHSTHTLEMGTGSNFVIERSESTPEFGTRFLRLRDNTIVNIEDRMISLQGGIVFYDNDAKLKAVNSEVIFNEVIFTDLDNPLASNYNSIGLEGINLTSCNIENSTFEYFERGVILTGNTSIPYFENNDFTRNHQGLVADNMDMIILKDNDFISNFTDGVNLQFIDIAKFHGNWIENSVNGCNFKNVMFAHLVGTHISQCGSNGVLAEKTNVLLKDDGEILGNNVGVHFVNNSAAIYMLSVGKCGCAKIINNNIGVKGDNIILDIDRIEHEFECNIFPLEPSRFDGNSTIFDICYSSTSSPFPTTILMRGNYWGGGVIGTNYSIKMGSFCDVNVAIDASEYATSYGDCESPGIVSDTPSNFPPGLEDDIKCEFLDGSTVIEVHEQSKSAFYDFYNGDYINAETKYSPVSSLNPAFVNDPPCVNKIHIARCIVDAIQNDQYATPNSYWLDSAQRPKHLSDSEITIYPNPTSGTFTAYSEKNKIYHLQIFNLLGELIKAVEFAREAEINVGQLGKGLYILQFNSADGVKIQVEKLMVE